MFRKNALADLLENSGGFLVVFAFSGCIPIAIVNGHRSPRFSNRCNGTVT